MERDEQKPQLIAVGGIIGIAITVGHNQTATVYYLSHPKTLFGDFQVIAILPARSIFDREAMAWTQASMGLLLISQEPLVCLLRESFSEENL